MTAAYLNDFASYHRVDSKGRTPGRGTAMLSGLSTPIGRRGALKLGATAAAGGLVLAGCTPSSGPAAGKGTPPAQRGGTALVSFGGADKSDTLDPALLISFFQAYAGGLLYDSLVAVDSNNKPVPALAESWEHDATGRVWRFKLHRGVEFHNGKPFTSEDAAFSIARLLDSKLGSAAYTQFSPVLKPGGIRTTGRYEVEFSLTRPDAFFPNMLSTFYPRMLPEGTTSAQVKTDAIGTGPFKLVSFTPGVELQVTRNPHYWQSGRPYLDGVKLSVISEPSTKLESVLSGDADACDSVEFSSYSKVQGSGVASMLTQQGSTLMTYIANQDAGANKDLRVRQALKYAIDRDEIVKTAFFGHAQASADVPIPPIDPLYPADLEAFPYDPDKARSLLRQAGYRDGLQGQLLTAPVSAGMTDIALLIQQQAKSAGIQFSVRQLPAVSYYTTAWGKPYWIDYWIRRHLSLMVPEMYFASSPTNETAFADPRVKQLALQAQSTLDAARQKQIYADLLDIVNRTSGQMIPCHVESGWAIKNGLHGVELNNANYATFTDAFLA